MIISLKDASKLIGISIIAFCAVFVCSLFLNFNIDLARIKDLITTPDVMAFYDAKTVMGKTIVAVSGGCLLLTSVVMLIFYIKNYIDTHRKQLGILKALGYSNFKIAKGFYVFGISIFIGTVLGFASSYLLLPKFYIEMNSDNILPEYTVHANYILVLYLVILPSIVFAILSVAYSYFKLKCPVIELLKGKTKLQAKHKKAEKPTAKQQNFLQDLKKSTVKSRSSLIFFIGFASFCYSAMTQMSGSMDELGAPMFTYIVLSIGFVLAFTTLFIAITTVVNSNKKHISIMKVFGYTFKECSNAILNGYRKPALIGFVIGTIYQYLLLKITLSMFNSTNLALPEYEFNFKFFAIVLVSFVVVYELIIKCYANYIKNVSIKEIMLD